MTFYNSAYTHFLFKTDRGIMASRCMVASSCDKVEVKMYARWKWLETNKCQFLGGELIFQRYGWLEQFEYNTDLERTMGKIYWVWGNITSVKFSENSHQKHICYSEKIYRRPPKYLPLVIYISLTFCNSA